MQLLEIGIAPRFLKVVGVKTLRLLGGESSVANIETIELFEMAYSGVQLTKMESEWPLRGLKRLTAKPLNEKSLPFSQMVNLELLELSFSDFGVVLSWIELGCLCKLRDLKVDYDERG
jgi:hypothetical protein